MTSLKKIYIHFNFQNRPSPQKKVKFYLIIVMDVNIFKALESPLSFIFPIQTPQGTKSGRVTAPIIKDILP